MKRKDPRTPQHAAPTPAAGGSLNQLPDHFFRQVFADMPTCGAIYRAVDDGQDFVFVDFNAAAEAIEQVVREDILGRRVTEAFPGVEEFGLLEVFRKVHRTGETITHPISFYTDGRLSGWRNNTVFTLGSDRIVAMYVDATSEKQAEETLRLSEEKYRTIFDNSTDAIFVHDANSGALIEVNEAMLQMYGCTIEQALTISPNDFCLGVSPYSAAEVASRIEQARNSGHVTFPWHARRLDGSLFWTEVKLTAVEISGRGHIIAMVRDVTEEKKQKEMQVQLQHVQKLESLGVLAGGIAHDFNNILMAIVGNTELALYELPSGSPARDNLHSIETSSHRAADLCRQLLAYSGKGRFVSELIDLSELVREILNMLHVSISKLTTLRLHLDDSLPLIEGDPTQIRQVLMNLVINASEALSDQNGVVSITTGTLEIDADALAKMTLSTDNIPGKRCFIEVADTGCGMDEATKGRIFEPFFTTKFTGRGLGMAAVMGIVRGHHGDLDLTTAPGQGTTFKVLMPIAGETPLATDPVKVDESLWHGTGLILLVDDEEAVRSTCARMLKRLGFETVTACDGREALDIFRERRHEITCVLMDLTMPTMGGEEAWHEMRRLLPEVKVILASGYNKQELIRETTVQGLVRFIQKPYKLALLSQTLRSVCED